MIIETWLRSRLRFTRSSTVRRRTSIARKWMRSAQRSFRRGVMLSEAAAMLAPEAIEQIRAELAAEERQRHAPPSHDNLKGTN